MTIDTAFDFRTEVRPGRDPDTDSPTLRLYHQLLWSKRLPSGASFELSDTFPRVYLYHDSQLGKFFLSSDAVMTTFKNKTVVKPVIGQLPESENSEFNTKAYTIGAMIVFPSNKIDGFATINVARGLHPSICDRFDLTVECLRRHYLDPGRTEDSSCFSGPNPLAPTLSRYADFFNLFGDFRGYVSFFLLDDLVTEDHSVKFFMPFDDFLSRPAPKDVGTYNEYRRRSIEFIEARNHRIQQLNI